MITAMTAFGISLATGFLLTPVIRNWAVRRGLLDNARSGRKTHPTPVPRLGGIAIVVAFFLPLLGLLLVRTSVGETFRSGPLAALALFAGGLAIAALGVYDDLRGADARTKLTVQVPVALLMYDLGLGIDQIAIPFGPVVDLGMLGLPFTVLWFVGIVNAVNLIDGLDGLAGGVAFIGFACTFVLALLHHEPLQMLFSAAMAGAVLGFLFYNFNPASVFMGDTGSMFLGFVLAATTVQISQAAPTTVDMLVPIIVLGLPIADTLLAILRRLRRRRPVFQADREHIHHLLLARGLSARTSCFALYLVAATLGASSVLIALAGRAWVAGLVVASLMAGTGVSLRWLGYARSVPDVARLRRRELTGGRAEPALAASAELRRTA